MPEQTGPLFTTRPRSSTSAGFFGYPRHRAEINVAAAKIHHQPLKRRHPLLRSTPDHCVPRRYRRPRSRCATQPHPSFFIEVAVFIRAPRNIAMRRTVKAVATHTRAGKIFPRQSAIVSRRQRLVETGIKYRHPTHGREKVPRRVNAA